MCAGKHNMGVLHRHTQRVQVLDCLICIYEQTLHLESRFHSWNSRSSEFSTQFDCNRKSILSRDTARVRILLRPKPKPDVFNLVQTECVVKMIAPFINYHRLKLERLKFWNGAVWPIYHRKVKRIILQNYFQSGVNSSQASTFQKISEFFKVVTADCRVIY